MYARVDHELHVDGVALSAIAEALGTPVYIYSQAVVAARYARLAHALTAGGGRIHYAVKANGNLAILQLLARFGAGFDIVSGGELERVLRAGGVAADTVFSGVGKSTPELDFALKAGIGCFNVESLGELDRLEARARLLGAVAPIAVRVNPDVDAGTHPYISTGLKENKFGVPEAQALDMYRHAAASPVLRPIGIACHIGSQISAMAPYVAALERLLGVVDALAAADVRLEHLDLGGGFGVRYRDEDEFDVDALGTVVAARVAERGLRLAVEPGRYLVADAGALLTRVEYLKPAPAPGHRGFAVVDAAMNDLLRPALYQAWHDIEPVADPQGEQGTPRLWDVVGPVCETGDFLGTGRRLALSEGDLLAVRGAGAYGMALSSNYNARRRAAEVLVADGAFRVIRRRETLRDQLALEVGLPSAGDEAP